MSATESRRRFPWTTAAPIVALVAVLAMLWQYPSAELVAFQAVWIGLALASLRTSSPRLQSWAVVGFVTALAIVIEIDDVRSGSEGFENLIEIVLDLAAFIALVMLARRHSRALAFEHEAAAIELRRNERQRIFYVNASHALRTPITVARGHAEMAFRETTCPSVRDDVMVVLDELERLTRATDRILRLSVVGETDPVRKELVDVDELIRSTVERWRPTAPRVWSAHAGCGGLEILADREALTEALDALIDNAQAATQPGGAIEIRGEVEGSAVVLSVIDDGPGIEGIDLPQLFDPFQIGPRYSWQASSGTGLGLAIVRAIARAHGGEATMYSTLGKGGITVSITLPCDACIAPPEGVSDHEPIVAS